MTHSISPFFSVVIPTKNRSYLIGSAIHSVLKQTYANFEIVIADNDESDGTQQVVASFQDPRIRYFRTGGLPMPDNWDFGCARALGDYITILSDRCVYRPRSLEIIVDTIKMTHAKLVSWFVDTFARDSERKMYARKGASGDVYKYSSQDVLEMFVESRAGVWGRYLPRTLNSCVHRSVLNDVRRTTGGRCCLPFAPDYTSGILQLAHTTSLVHIDLPLYISCYKGNGFSFRTQGAEGELARQYISEVGMTREGTYQQMPIRALLSHNLIMRDFIEVRRLCSPRLDHLTPNRVVYYKENCRDAVVRRNNYSEWDRDRDEILKALAQEPEQVQNQVRQTQEYRALVGSQNAAFNALARFRQLPQRLWRFASFEFQTRLLRLPKLTAPVQFEAGSRNVFDAIEMDESLPRVFQPIKSVMAGDFVASLLRSSKFPWRAVV
jgi:glycosyltransferase involved in cell wall biosynthesis